MNIIAHEHLDVWQVFASLFQIIIQANRLSTAFWTRFHMYECVGHKRTYVQAGMITIDQIQFLFNRHRNTLHSFCVNNKKTFFSK